MQSLCQKIRKFIIWKIYFPLSHLVQIGYRSVYQQDKYIAQVNVVAETHKNTFKNYKNIYNGQDIVVIATGPSLDKYKPIDNCINIGVNKAITYDKVDLDYFFAIDYSGIRPYQDTIMNYRNVNLKKFFAILPERVFGFCECEHKSKSIIPESLIFKLKANKYFVYGKRPHSPAFLNPDIDKTWLADGGSCIFSTMQFALFTNPRKIYIVGCDCTTGYFSEKNDKIKPNKVLVKTWKEIKKYRDAYYPDTEIISVNPVGLKGIFTDLYQDRA